MRFTTKTGRAVPETADEWVAVLIRGYEALRENWVPGSSTALEAQKKLAIQNGFGYLYSPDLVKIAQGIEGVAGLDWLDEPHVHLDTLYRTLRPVAYEVLKVVDDEQREVARI